MPLADKLRIGQKTMADSQPVVVASDQSAIPVSGTVTVTGVATAANQLTEITSLSNIDTNTQYSAAQSAALPTRNALIAGNGSTTIPTAATEGTTTRQWFSTTGRAHTMNDPGYDFAAVTPNDAANLPTVPTRALYVGTGGNIVVDSVSSTSITFRNVPPGTMLPIAVYRVRATSTTASNIVAIY